MAFFYLAALSVAALLLLAMLVDAVVKVSAPPRWPEIRMALPITQVEVAKTNPPAPAFTPVAESSTAAAPQRKPEPELDPA